MAEFVMKALVKEAGKENDFLIESAATSTEEIGNDIHYGTRQILNQKNIGLMLMHQPNIQSVKEVPVFVRRKRGLQHKRRKKGRQ